ELTGSRLVLYLDQRPVGVPLSPIPSLAVGRIPILTWDLTAGEFARLSTDRLIEIDRLIDYAITRAGRPLLSPVPGTGGPAGPGQVRVRNIDAQLRVTNPALLSVDIIPRPGGGARLEEGVQSLKVDLAPNALLGLRTRGAVGAGAGYLFTEVTSLNLASLKCSYLKSGAWVDVSTETFGIRGARVGVDFTDFGATRATAGARSIEAHEVKVQVLP
ncbi:MAG: hypothetical protein ABWZ91_16525, partial [Nocardioides sp.]